MNENGNAAGDTVTASEAAARLGIPLPRLMRLLRRPEFAPHVGKGERETRTGTRTVTVVSVSVMPALRTATEEHKHEQNGPERYRPDDAAARMQLSVVYETLLREKDARIADLAAALEHERESHRRTQTLLALAPPQAPTETGPGAPESGATVESGGCTEPAQSEAQERETRRAWWQFWRREEA